MLRLDTDAIGSRSADSKGNALLVWLLFAVYMFNIVDRNILVVILDDIKKEFDLADWELGILTGFAFSLVYCFSSFMIAQLAEKKNRVSIISLSLAFWSIATMLAAVVQNFAQLLVTRVLVGVGEGGSAPASLSLISERIPVPKRPTAIAHYTLGAPVGSLVGVTIGGIIAAHFGWRVALLCVGLPGLVLALILLRVLSDHRPGFRASVDDRYGQDNNRALLRLYGDKRSLLWLNLGGIGSAALITGMFAFLGSFVRRFHSDEVTALSSWIHATFGFEPGFVGAASIIVAVILGVFGTAGTLGGGHLNERLSVRGLHWHVLLPSIGIGLGSILLAFGLLANSLSLFVACAGLGIATSMLLVAPTLAAVQGISPKHMRARCAAVWVILNNGIGGGIGPILIGGISDLFSHSSGGLGGLRIGMLSALTLGIWSSFSYWMSSKYIAREFEG